MKVVLWAIGIICFIFITLQFLVWLQDEYLVLQKIVSPDSKRVAVLVGNHGGGAAGYCKDLLYDFPNSDNLPTITSNWAESRNKEHLVKVVFCGDIKELSWKGKELIWKNKGSIADF